MKRIVIKPKKRFDPMEGAAIVFDINAYANISGFEIVNDRGNITIKRDGIRMNTYGMDLPLRF